MAKGFFTASPPFGILVRIIGERDSAGVEGEALRVCREDAGTRQGEPTAETQAALRAERVARWLRVPLIVAALLAIPTIIVQESDLGRSLGDPRRGPGLVHLGDVRGQPGHHARLGSRPAALVDQESYGRADRGTHPAVPPGDVEAGARAADREARLADGGGQPPAQRLLAAGVALRGPDRLHRRGRRRRGLRRRRTGTRTSAPGTGSGGPPRP